MPKDQLENRKNAGIIACMLFLLTIAVNTSASEQVSMPVSISKQSLYSIDASGGDIKFVLEALARQSGTNIVISPDIKGTITAHLREMPVDALLDNLAAAHGFDWNKQGNTYVVREKDKTNIMPPPASEPEALIWRCRHIKANNMVTLLTGMFPNCKVAIGPSSISPELQNPLSSAGDTLGSSTTSSSSSSNSSSSKSDDNASTVVLYGDSKDIEGAKAMLEKLDVARPQIAIEVAVTEISSSLNKELGINWSWNDITLKEGSSTGIKIGNLNKSAMTFTGTLAALAKTGGSRLLAQPNISVIDGGYADILIGDRILFPKVVSYSDNGTPLYDKEEERVGIYLQIAPRVTEDDEILLTLYPQVSLVTTYLKTSAGDYPQISTREARTTVSVKSGSTLAIGGLIKDDDVKNAEKIPLLGDLPIIGQFFRHNKTTKDHTEIVIFLTPKIVGIGK